MSDIWIKSIKKPCQAYQFMFNRVALCHCPDLAPIIILSQSDWSSSAGLLWDAEWKTPQSSNDLRPLLQPTGAAGVPLGERTASVQRGRNSLFFIAIARWNSALSTHSLTRDLQDFIVLPQFHFENDAIHLFDVSEQTLFSLHSCFNSRTPACLRSAPQLDPVPKCTAASPRNTCEGCAVILWSFWVCNKVFHFCR